MRRLDQGLECMQPPVQSPHRQGYQICCLYTDQTFLGTHECLMVQLAAGIPRVHVVAHRQHNGMPQVPSKSMQGDVNIGLPGGSFQCLHAPTLATEHIG